MISTDFVSSVMKLHSSNIKSTNYHHYKAAFLKCDYTNDKKLHCNNMNSNDFNITKLHSNSMISTDLQSHKVPLLDCDYC